jgi:lipid-A-disaccharide synthase
LMGLPRMFRIMGELTRAAQTRRPDVVMLIDLPDFNIRLAKRLKKLGIPVVYYISPQIWAWRQGRVEQIRRFVDKMLVILPFEKDFYKSHEVDVEFVGHPLVEELADAPTQAIARTQLGLQKPSGPILALLPGSRQKEVSRHLPIMLEAVGLLRKDAPGIQALIPVRNILDNPEKQAALKDGFEEIRASLGDGAVAGRVADAIAEFLDSPEQNP